MRFAHDEARDLLRALRAKLETELNLPLGSYDELVDEIETSRARHAEPRAAASEQITLRVADYTTLPGPRYASQGAGSGEQFREERLRPAFDAARAGGTTLTVELDGVRYGYPTTFLEEAFGGLARQVGAAAALETLRPVSTAEPMLTDEIQRYIEWAGFNSRREQEAGRK